VRFQPRPEYYVSTGVYQANPRHATDGLDLTFAGTGVIVRFEVGLLSGLGGRGLPGEYKLGGYYDSSRTPYVFLDINGLSAGLTGAPFAQRNGRWGVYALATQMVYRASLRREARSNPVRHGHGIRPEDSDIPLLLRRCFLPGHFRAS
jgi:porin